MHHNLRLATFICVLLLGSTKRTNKNLKFSERTTKEKSFLKLTQTEMNAESHAGCVFYLHCFPSCTGINDLEFSLMGEPFNQLFCEQLTDLKILLTKVIHSVLPKTTCAQLFCAIH